MDPKQDATPDLPPIDPKADRGNDLPESKPVEIELSDDELKVIGKGPAEEIKPEGEKAAEEIKPEGEKAAEQPAKVEDKPRDKEGKFIPKARFDEVNKKARARVAQLENDKRNLEERLGIVEGKAPDTKDLEAQLDAKSEEYGKLIADGDLAKAKDVMREINKINRNIGLIEATAINNAHATESQHVDSLSDLVTMYMEAYPVFDASDKDHYKQEYVDFVAQLQGGFEGTGKSPAEALRQAVEIAVIKFKLDPEPEALKAEEPAKPDKGAERKTAAVDKAVKAAAAQSPALEKVGTDSDKMGMSKIDVESLDYDTFSKLSESTIKRLRGDLAA